MIVVLDLKIRYKKGIADEVHYTGVLGKVHHTMLDFKQVPARVFSYRGLTGLFPMVNSRFLQQQMHFCDIKCCNLQSFQMKSDPRAKDK